MKTLTRTAIIFAWILLITIVFYFPSWKAQILPQYDKSVNVFAWGDILDLDVLTQFEKETGIQVNLSFYASNEELGVKMKATGGKGYDLIMPSDYTVAQLLKEDLLQPLDRTQLDFWSKLNPALLNHAFDPSNQFSVPFEWELFGFVVDTSFFKGRPLPDSWKAIFDKTTVDYQIAMKNDPVEVFQFAASYLFGPLQSVTEKQFQAIRKLLLKQRKWVVAYSDFRADYFIATGNAPIAISTTSYIKRIQKNFPKIQFIVPKEGSFVTIENFCIPKASNKQKYTYALLNYLYRKESLTAHQKRFLNLPPSSAYLDEMDLNPEEEKLLTLTPQEFAKFQFFKNLVPQQKVRDLWVEVKSF